MMMMYFGHLRSGGVEVTSCEAPKTAVSESGVALLLQEIFKVEAE